MERRFSEEGPPSTGGILDGRTRRARRRRQLVAFFSNALGGDAVLTEGQRTDIRRAAELTALSEAMRALAMQEDGPGGAGAISAMIRLEGAADRAVRRLNLPTSKAATPAMGLHDIVTRHAAGARADAEEAD
jgi:hypothetical protein